MYITVLKVCIPHLSFASTTFSKCILAYRERNADFIKRTKRKTNCLEKILFSQKLVRTFTRYSKIFENLNQLIYVNVQKIYYLV